MCVGGLGLKSAPESGRGSRTRSGHECGMGQHLKGTEQWGQVFKNVKQKGGAPLYTPLVNWTIICAASILNIS